MHSKTLSNAVLAKWVAGAFFLMVGPLAFSQNVPDTTAVKIDSLRLKKFNTDSVARFFKASDTSVATQLEKIEQYIIRFNKINSKLKRGLDTSFINHEIEKSNAIVSIANTNLQELHGKASLKILTNTKNLLQQQQEQLEEWQARLALQNTELNEVKGQLRQVKTDSTLLIAPADSVLFTEYINKLKLLGEKLNTAENTSTRQLRQLGVLQNNISSNYLSITNLIDDANYQLTGFGQRLFNNEVGFIWNYQRDPTHQSDFTQTVTRSLQQSKTLVGFYSTSNWTSRILVLLLAALFYFLMKRSISQIKAEGEGADAVLVKAHHIPAHLIASTVVFSLMLIPFIYRSAPQAFTQSLWTMQTVALIVLLRKKLTWALGAQIVILLALFYLTSFANLLIETTYAERWLQLLISGTSVALGLWMLLTKEKNYFSQTAFYQPLVYVFLTMNGLALILNVLGRVTVAKVLNTGANYGFIEAINLFVFLEIIIDAVFLLVETGKKTSRLSAYFEFNNIEQQMKKGLGFFIALFWLMIFTESLHLYDIIFGSIETFLRTEQSMGDMTFSFGSIGIFILIIWVSTLLSKMTSFLFGAREFSTSRNADSKLGSTLLLVRLGILTTGLLLAFAASGIPLDKLALIIGALGVGIGFGLQNIVNNLVSGIVLAFEKPIQIGDIIEVGERSGTVKEVGIRSSKLLTFDGSEVIIPNGDMLSQHLINWTRNNEHRRVVIAVGVAYGSDIEKVKEAILAVVIEHKQVFATPEPFLRVSGFGDSSVDLKVYFWTEMENWFELKSEMSAAIYSKLNEEGITIPFPQRDLHIKTVDATAFNPI